MAEYKLGEIETIFADIIWDNEPVSSRRLTELAEERLNWKRTTTYTILKRLCDKPGRILCPAERDVRGGNL